MSIYLHPSTHIVLVDTATTVTFNHRNNNKLHHQLVRRIIIINHLTLYKYNGLTLTLWNGIPLSIKNLQIFFLSHINASCLFAT